MDYQDQLTTIFLQEATELLDDVELAIVSLECSPSDKELLNRIFRAVHTIKGGAGTVGAESLVQFTHVMENVLDRLRAGEINVSMKLATHLLASADAIRELTDALAAGKATVEPTEKHEQLLEALRQYVVATEPEDDCTRARSAKRATVRHSAQVSRRHPRDGAGPAHAAAGPVGDRRSGRGATRCFEPPRTRKDGSFQSLTSLGTSRFDRPIRSTRCVRFLRFVIDENPICVAQITQSEPSAAAPSPLSPPPSPLPEAPRTKPAPAEATMDPIPKATEQQQDATRHASDNSVRVTVRVLDKLMTLAGEMVLTRNQLAQSAGEGDLYLVHRAVQRVDVITMELQDAIMATRMQSVGTVFRKFKRVIRDLAVRLNKTVELELVGEDVELDRTLIEAISEPLTHLVRNAIDHGIEKASDRTQAGKPAAGTIRLAAAHKAGQVIIEVCDDGRGISTEKLKARALQIGTHTRDELNAMNDKMLRRLIFSPGLSTAESVSEVSGRGVGMDVVMSNLSQIGGVVDVDSQEGQGTTIRVKLPLTLAILPSLLVETQHERFAIPQVNLVELHRIPARGIDEQLELVGEASVLRLRGKLLPLVKLRDVLGMPEEKTDDSAKRLHPALPPGANAMNVAVISAGDFDYGIIVDTLLDTF